MALRLDGYVRVSRIGGRQGEGYISPEDQRHAIEGYAHELGGEIVAWHDDQDFTGGNVERPGFQAALERIRSGKSDGLVVKRIDRFARSVPDGSAIVREIVDERDAIFASCEERIDPKTPDGRYMLNSFLNNAELFLNRIKAGWWTAKARAVARGVHIGPPPIGYQREKSQPLVPHPVYGPAITELFKRAGDAATDAELARWMTDRAPRESGQPWQSSEIRRWLSTRAYLGEVHYGSLVNLKAHDPLTDPETFERAQRQPGAPRRANGRKFLLSGLVRCSCCRYSMSGFNYGGADHATPVYRCGRARTRGCSEASVIVAKRLEEHVVGLVRDHLRGLQLEAVDAGIDLAALEREVADAEAELVAFASDLDARRRLGEGGWQSAFEARANDRDEKRAARDRGYSNSRVVAVPHDVDDLDHDALRDLLDGMIRHVFVRRRPRGAEAGDRVLVIWSDDPRAIDVPGPHRSARFEPIRW
jgi:DNA invertase Pin-like site-specific DNA recombinase